MCGSGEVVACGFLDGELLSERVHEDLCPVKATRRAAPCEVQNSAGFGLDSLSDAFDQVRGVGGAPDLIGDHT